MFLAVFAEPVAIDSQDTLRRRFGTDTIHMADGATVTFSGRITLHPGVVFQGRSRLSGPLRIETGCVLSTVNLGGNTTIRSYSDIANLSAGAGNVFGPFCFLREDCVVGNDCILGAHVEATRSTFGDGVKISHRAFIGDALLGDGVIIGAGVVFCNYHDGKGRKPTQVGARAAIGSGTMLVAPLTIGDRAVIAAGSVITKTVLPGETVIQKRV